MTDSNTDSEIRQKTVLVFPVNGVGHVNASLTLADKLKRDHNCRTVFLTIGPTIKAVKNHGHEHIELDETNIYEEEVDGEKRIVRGIMKWSLLVARAGEAFETDSVNSFSTIMDVLGGTVIDELVDNNHRIEQAIEHVNPDLIILDYTVAPLCVVRDQDRRPWVNVFSPNPLGVTQAVRPDGIKPPHFCGAKLFTKAERQRLAAEEPERWAQQLQQWKEQTDQIMSKFVGKLSKIKELYESNGVIVNEMKSYSPHLNIYMCPKELDYDRDDDILVYPPRWVRCNSLVRQPIGEQDSREIQHWSQQLDEAMKGKKEMIYFSLGSIASARYSLMKRYIDFLSDDQERLYVVSKGIEGDKFQLNASNMIGANYLPQTFFLNRAKLVIIHGGNNSISESLYYGKPMIVLPMFADQLDNAQRVEDVGLGCRLDLFRSTKQELRNAIERLSGDTELIERARLAGEEMRSCDDLDRVVSLMKELIDKKCLDEDTIKEYRNRP